MNRAKIAAVLIYSMGLFLILGCGGKGLDQASDETKIRKTQAALRASAGGFEQANVLPPAEGYQVLTEVDPWGGYFRIEYHNSRPCIRSAGPDGIFYTEDDIVAFWGDSVLNN